MPSAKRRFMLRAVKKYHTSEPTSSITSIQSFSHRDIFTTRALLCLYFTIESLEAGIIGSMVVMKNITTASSA